MKIQVMSDLHISFWGRNLVEPQRWFQEIFIPKIRTDADVLVLAGDVLDLRARDWNWSAARMQEFMAVYRHVVFVPGNHEFYGTSIADTDLDELSLQTGAHVLRPGKVAVIDGQRFLGGVMFQPQPPEGEETIKISDHWCIYDFDEQAPAEYRALRTYLESELKPEDIVVTHHAPSLGSLDDQYRDDLANRWFITPEMEDVIDSKNPRLWIHGHTHTPFDYVRGNTRVVCNPLGYPGENVKFNPRFVIEI